MQKQRNAAYDRILDAAVESLETEGLPGTTTRVIAQKAGVNIASINYYFRSKENLLGIAAETLLNRAFDWDALEESDDMDSKDRLVYGLNMLLEGALMCNEPAGAFIGTVLQSNMHSLVLRRVQSFMRRVVDELCENGETDRDAVEMNVLQVFSAVLLPGLLMPAIGDSVAGVDLVDPRSRMHYIRNTVEKLL